MHLDQAEALYDPDRHGWLRDQYAGHDVALPAPLAAGFALRDGTGRGIGLH